MRLLHVVGHDNDRDPLDELGEQLFDPLGGARVQRGRGLVHEEHVGFNRECPGDTEPLLLASRQARRRLAQPMSHLVP